MLIMGSFFRQNTGHFDRVSNFGLTPLWPVFYGASGLGWRKARSMQVLYIYHFGETHGYSVTVSLYVYTQCGV